MPSGPVLLGWGLLVSERVTSEVKLGLDVFSFAGQRLAFFAWLFCALASQQTDGESAAVMARGSRSLGEVSVVASTRQLDVGNGGTAILTTDLPVPAHETIVIKDLLGRVVRRLVDQDRGAGIFADTWNGRGESGDRLRDEQYRWVAAFRSEAGEHTIDLSHEVDGDAEVKSHPEYAPWDPFHNRPLVFSTTFERPGEIALVFARGTYQLALGCDPPEFFCRFVEGYRPAGEFLYEWAEVDDTGAFRPDIHAIFAISHHENLAKNAIVVFGGSPAISHVAVSPTEYRPDFGTQVVTFSLKTFQGEPVSGAVTWTNQQSRSILRTLKLLEAHPGLVSATWNGRADNGARVAPGAYTIAVTVTDSLGQRVQGEILTTVEY